MSATAHFSPSKPWSFEDRFLSHNRTFPASAPNSRSWPLPAVQPMKSIRDRPMAVCDPFETVEPRSNVRDKSLLADVDLRRAVVSY